jgi:hypothetical protein
MPDEPKPYRKVEIRPLNGGVNDTPNEPLLPLSQTPSALNVDFNEEGVDTSGGSTPFNRQSAPKGAIRCRPDPALSPLYFEANKAVPTRGYGYLPYVEETDIGGRFDLEGDPLLTTDTYYVRRGRSFEINGFVEIPTFEKLYETETRGSAAPAVGAEAAGFGGYSFDEAQDECFTIIQKGGDRTAPMSWAWAIVNVGRGLGLAGVPASRVSNYALVFIWLDAMGWGITDQIRGRYNLSSGQNPNVGAAAQNATQAYRAIVVHKYVEPGKTYGYAVQLKMDSGSPGAAAANTLWRNDGFFKVLISDAGTVSTFAGVQTGGSIVVTPANSLEVYKGPVDSIEYLVKYGIRFAGRDARFLGLGQRFIPWQIAGFLPFGQDDTPLKNGGFQMVDRSANTVAQLYGAGVHTLTASHAGGAPAITFNHAALVAGNTNGGASPWAQGGTGGPGAYTRWPGLGNTVLADANPEALRRYYAVLPNDTAATQRGALLTLGTFTQPAGVATIDIGAPGAMGAWGPTPVLIQAFRWTQRALDICEIRTWRVPRAYDDTDAILAARRKLSLRQSIDLNDALEPDIEDLQELFHCDEAEGTVLKESVVGGLRNGFCAPFGLGTTEAGVRGKQMVFLSGEGEAPSTVDLADNPIVQREIGNMLAGRTQGFAIELSCAFTEAYYAIQDNSAILPDKSLTGVGALIGSRPRFVPELLSWDIRDPLGAGLRSTPKPLLTLTHRGMQLGTNTVPFKFPMGFSVEVAHASDQQDIEPVVPSDLLPFYLTDGGVNVTRYGLTAPWVGKHVTIQIGIQSTGTTDQYDVYIAMTPKDAFFPVSGDPGDAEMAYWTDGAHRAFVDGAGPGPYYTANADYQRYFSVAHLTIKAKDLARSCITVGRWNCGTLGFCEMQPRMLVDELRVYASSAPGALPPVSGGVVALRNGKLEGTDCVPPRALELEDILTPIGPGLQTANVTEGSKVVTPPTSARFFTAEARSTIRSLKGTYLYVEGDEHLILDDQTVGARQEEFYLVTDVLNPALPATTAGSTATLSTTFADATRNGAGARSLRLIYYTRFEDDVRDMPLTLGPGRAFEPGVTTVSDVIVSEPFWANESPITGSLRLRLYWPGGRIALRDLLPQRVRGLGAARRNPCLGIHAHDDAIYYAFQGALYEADDRWRSDGPSPDLPKSLAFRAREVAAGITTGLQRDRVEFGTAQKIIFAGSATDGYITRYDAWMDLDECGEYQTILWVGDPTTHPGGFAGTGAGEHKVHAILRLSRGRPEFVFGSTAFYTGTTRPEKGLFIATASTPVNAGGWTKVTWFVGTRTNGTIVQIPYCKIMGKHAMVTVNARDNNASITAATDWLMAASIVNPGSGSRALMGVSRDSYRAPISNVPFSAAALGINIQPQRFSGYLHSLCGKLAHVKVTRVDWAGGEPPDFDPFADDGSEIQSTRFNALSDAMGVGHKVHEEAEDQYGTIISHPFISMWHELGMSTDMASFADYGTVVYATNGGQPARIQNDEGGLAGILPPNTPLTFHVERLELWKPNERPRDPTAAAATTGAAQQRNHYANYGNNYTEQSPLAAGHAEIAFTRNATTGEVHVFGFKCYVYFHDTSGRQCLFTKRLGVDSGGIFVECNDGKAVCGWYDQFLKKRVMVETDACVFEPGIWHYLNVRKWFPKGDVLEGNWENEFFSNGAIRRVIFTAVTNAAAFVVGAQVAWTAAGVGPIVGTGLVTKSYGQLTAGTPLEFILVSGVAPGATSIYTSPATAWSAGSASNAQTSALPVRPMKDKLLVRRFSLSPPAFPTDAHPLEAKITPTITAISFTAPVVAAIIPGSPPTIVGSPLGTTATGQVTLPGIQYTGAALGIVNVNAGYPAVPSVFTGDMVGMYWQWGTVGGGAPAFVGVLYKILTVNSPTQIAVVVAGTATIPNFAGITATEGAVFSGVGLAKSQDFDASRMPDDTGATATYPIHAFGCPESVQPLAGVAPFNGEFASFGWTAALVTPIFDATVVPNLIIGYEDARVFQQIDTSRAIGGAADPINVGGDTFIALISGAGPGELECDDWVPAAAPSAQQGTWTCYDVRPYAAVPTNQITSQPRPDLVITQDADVGRVVSANALALTWKYLQAVTVMAGTRFARVAFFDPAQNEVSDPGPALTIRPQGEDAQNPSGQVRYVLSNLPAPRQAGALELWVYLSLAGGDSSTMYRVAKVPVGTREVSVMAPDAQIGEGPALSLTKGAPPRCSFLAAAQKRMFYGRLEVQLDGIARSEPGFPVSIDYSRTIERFTDGFGVDLTMMRSLDGYLVIAKERALAGAFVDQNDVLVIDTISEEVGCQGFLSAATVGKRLHFLSDRGLEVVTRLGVTNLGIPVFISKNVKRFFMDVLDRRFIRRVSAAINRRRDQYVLACRAVGETKTNRRIAVEFQPALIDTPTDNTEVSGYRFSLYRGPNITALATVPAPDGGTDVMVGGTEEGMAVWLDRDDTQLVMAGDDGGVWGFAKLASSTALRRDAVIAAQAGAIDSTLEGARGCPIRYVDQDDQEREVTCISAEGSIFHFDEPVDRGVPIDTTFTIGAQKHSYETPWSRLGSESVKTLLRIDVELSVESQGQARIRVFGDFDRVNPLFSSPLELNEPRKRVEIEGVEKEWLKVVIDTAPDAVGTRFSLLGVILKLIDTEYD